MANKKPILSSIEIDKYLKTIRYKAKKEIFKLVVNSDNLKQRKTKSRTAAFEKTWRIGEQIISKKYTGKSRSTMYRNIKRVGDLVKESIFSKTGIINELEKHNSRFEENSDEEFKDDLKTAEIETYKARTESFFAKYGEEKDSRGFTLNDYFHDYENRVFTKQKMNKIIKTFQDVYLSGYDASVYKEKKTRAPYTNSQKYK